jgi:hypothetical protein
VKINESPRKNAGAFFYSNLPEKIKQDNRLRKRFFAKRRFSLKFLGTFVFVKKI